MSNVATRGLRALAAAAAFGTLLGACSSSHRAAAPTTTTVPAASGSFCRSLTKTLDGLETATSQSQLADIRRDFPKALAEAEAMTSVPASLAGVIPGLIGDLKAVNSWLQTEATQADLSSNKVPAAIAKPFSDLEAKGATVIAYAQKDCGYKLTTPASTIP
jgi:hypothetical protein